MTKRKRTVRERTVGSAYPLDIHPKQYERWFKRTIYSDAYKARALARKRYGGNMKLVLAFEAGFRAGRRKRT